MMSRKIYNNRDKGGAYMSNGIYSEIKKRIELSDGGTVFVTSDFADLATITTVRKCLGIHSAFCHVTAISMSANMRCGLR